MSTAISMPPEPDVFQPGEVLEVPPGVEHRDVYRLSHLPRLLLRSGDDPARVFERDHVVLCFSVSSGRSFERPFMHFKSYRNKGDRRAVEQIFAIHGKILNHIVRRYSGSRGRPTTISYKPATSASSRP